MSTTPTPTVLMVDDRPENLMALGAVLEGDDRELLEAHSGPEALKLLLKHDVAVVLLDVQMPDMDGYEVLELMRGRKETRAVPVIFVTAIRRDEEHARLAYDGGAVDYLFKPLDPAITAAKVDVFLELWRRRRLAEDQARELRDLTAALERSNTDLRQFASIVAHDLREPLQTMLGFGGLLQQMKEPYDPAKLERYVGRVVGGATHMQHLIDGLLEWSRVQTGGRDLARVSADTVAHRVLEALEDLASRHGANIEVSSLPDVLADEHQLGQLLQNLVANAIKFHGEAPPHVRVEAESDGAHVQFRVCDNGIGIPIERQDAVFGMFAKLHASTDYAGHGIGLAVCKRIVERHGGRIWLESEPGRGTTFHFTLRKAA